MIVVSSDLMEVMGISDRILVMSEGAITGELNRDEADESRLLHWLCLARAADNRSLTMNNKKRCVCLPNPACRPPSGHEPASFCR